MPRIHSSPGSDPGFPTGCHAQSTRQNVFRRHMVGVVRIAAENAGKERLRLAVLRFAVQTGRTGLTRERRRNLDDLRAEELRLPFKLLEEHAPALIEDRPVESAFLLHVRTGLIHRAFRRCRHVLDLEILTHDHRVVFADHERLFLKEVLANVGDVLVETCDALLLLAPVASELRHPGEASLFKLEFSKVPLERVARLDKRSVRKRDEALDAHVDADRIALVLWSLVFELRLDGHVPSVGFAAHGDVLGLAFDEAAPAIPHPANAREQDLPPGFINLEVLRIAEGVLRDELLVDFGNLASPSKNRLKALKRSFMACWRHCE